MFEGGLFLVITKAPCRPFRAFIFAVQHVPELRQSGGHFMEALCCFNDHFKALSSQFLTFHVFGTKTQSLAVEYPSRIGPHCNSEGSKALLRLSFKVIKGCLIRTGWLPPALQAFPIIDPPMMPNLRVKMCGARAQKLIALVPLAVLRPSPPTWVVLAHGGGGIRKRR